jgi:hypothetical protein
MIGKLPTYWILNKGGKGEGGTLNTSYTSHINITKGQQTWVHYEHNKCCLLTINPISSPQTINGTNNDQTWNIHNNINIVTT